MEEGAKEVKEEIKAVETISPVSPVKKSRNFLNMNNINWKSKELWFIIATVVILIAILVSTIIIRTQNIPLLKDTTTGNYTLAPDLDPFLYLRHAQEIVAGTLQEPDIMRAAPHGSANYAVTNLMPWAIVYIYKFLNIFWQPPTASVEFAAIIAPVIFFSLTLLVFFFFVKKLFSFLTTKNNATIIALVATLFYSVMTEMLHRTTAGVPEIESLGMLFFWLAFLFFAFAWQSDKIKKTVLFGILAGAFTGLMIFTWGGFRYIFMTFSLAALLIFFFEKHKKKNFLVFTSWLIPSLIFSLVKNLLLEHFLTVNAFMPAILDLIKSITDTGFGIAVFGIMIIDMILFNTNLKKIKEKIKLPESVISIIVVALIGLIGLVVVSPGSISQLFSRIIEGFLYPFGHGRIGLTVAENKAPYFADVFQSFGFLFWLFFFGTILLFYEAIKNFDKKKKIWLNVFFILFLVTFIFSRISQQSLLNGENAISRILYFGGLIVFVIALAWTYIKAYTKKDEKTLGDFKEINFAYILLLAFILWITVSMRGAIRLFFIISPAIIIASAYLPVKLAEYSFKTKDSLYKIVLWCLVLVAAVFLIIPFINNVNGTVQIVKYTAPGPYEEQWQNAMAWVRENTSENAIFAHWWDYGYWVQTIGQRPTVVDGGHAYHNGFWNHLTGREVLTAQNETEALEFLYAHNVSYLLIDSTDIGKYPAYSSIGSDETGKDRLSWISMFVLDDKQTQETKNETAFVYSGGTMVDDDIVWQDQLLPREKAGLAGFIVVTEKNTSTIKEVKAVFVYNNLQYRIPIRKIYLDNKLYEIAKENESVDGALYFLPRLTQQGVNPMGAALYLSEKLLNSEMVKLYLLNEMENFELVYTEPAIFIERLRNEYNVSVDDFLVAGDIQGPIKIFKINYPENFTVDEAKLKRYMQPNSDLPFALW